MHYQRFLTAVFVFLGLGMFWVSSVHGQTQPQATVIHVAPTGTDSASCGSQAQPCRTIQQAVDKASGPTTIQIAQGVYTGSGAEVVRFESRFDRSLEITLRGGYETTNWTIPGSGAGATILDGQSARRVVNILSTGDSVLNLTLENLVIQNGFVNTRGDLTEPWYTGGGLLCRDNNVTKGKVSVTMRTVTFQNNRVQGTGATNAIASGGGASFLYDCRVTIENVTFDGNQVHGGNAVDGTRGGQAVGGGLFTGNKTIVNANVLTLTNNVAQAGDGGSGYGWGTPDGLGGGAAFQLNQVTLRHVYAEGNKAIGGGNTTQQAGTGSGGGLFFELNPGEVVVTDSILKDNLAQGGHTQQGIGGIASGGGLMSTDIELRLERIALVANRSIGGDAPDGGDAGGGALYFTRVKTDHVSKITGVNLIIADNVAQAGQGSNRWGGGGGIFAQDSQLDLSHVTMSNNQVLNTMQGPAIVSQHNLGSSELKFRYGIIANHEGRDTFNNPRAPIVVQKAGDVASISDTLFHNNTVDFDTKQEASHQPGLAPSTITITGKLSGDPMFLSPGAPDYDYHIGLGSAALDKAGSSTTGEDIDGETRPFGAARDVGADEAAALHLYVHSVKPESLVLTWVVNAKLLPTFNGFEVEIVDESTGQSSKQQVDGTKRFLVVDNLKNGTRYRFTVRAMDATGKALAASETRTGTPQAHHVFLPTAMK